MLENFSFTSYVVDTDIKSLLKKELSKYKKVLVITGEKSLKSFEEKLEYALNKKEHLIKSYGGECSYSNVEEILKESCDKGFDLVLGIGGGKSIDTAKLTAFKMNLPIITIPTIASTCAATSSLSVVYNENGSFLEIAEFPAPAVKTFIDLETIKRAPNKYIWAGMGDTLAKFYELDLKYRYTLKNSVPINYPSRLGKECSTLCRELILKYGEQAYFSKRLDEPFKKVVLSIIVNTGMVSNLINEELNGAIAHSVCYGLGNIPSVEKNHLHGEMVAFGILVQLLLEKNIEEYHTLFDFYKKVNFPTVLTKFISLKEFEKVEDKVLDIILNSVDIPYLEKMGFVFEKSELKKAMFFNI